MCAWVSSWTGLLGNDSPVPRWPMAERGLVVTLLVMTRSSSTCTVANGSSPAHDGLICLPVEKVRVWRWPIAQSLSGDTSLSSFIAFAISCRLALFMATWFCTPLVFTLCRTGGIRQAPTIGVAKETGHGHGLGCLSVHDVGATLCECPRWGCKRYQAKWVQRCVSVHDGGANGTRPRHQALSRTKISVVLTNLKIRKKRGFWRDYRLS